MSSVSDSVKPREPDRGFPDALHFRDVLVPIVDVLYTGWSIRPRCSTRISSDVTRLNMSKMERHPLELFC